MTGHYLSHEDHEMLTNQPGLWRTTKKPEFFNHFLTEVKR